MSEGKQGDLIIDFRAREHYRDPGLLPDDAPLSSDHLKEIVQFRTSVHPSNDSDEIITIKSTMELDDGSQKTIYSYTSATKTTPGFYPVLARRCGDLDTDIYNFKAKDSRIVRIGPIEDDFMLFYQIFVGPRDLTFAEGAHPAFGTKQFRIGAFNIVILYTFLSITMHDTSFTRIHGSRDRSAVRVGLSIPEARDFFGNTMMYLRNECLVMLRKDTSLGGYGVLVENSRFFRTGQYGPEYERWWKSLNGDQIRLREGIRPHKYKSGFS